MGGNLIGIFAELLIFVGLVEVICADTLFEFQRQLIRLGASDLRMWFWLGFILGQFLIDFDTHEYQIRFEEFARCDETVW